MLLSRKEMNVVALAAVVFSAIVSNLVDQVVNLVPVVRDLVPQEGLPRYALQVVVFTLAIKYVLPRM